MSADLLPPDVDYRAPLPRNRAVGIGCIGAGFIMADCHLVAYRQAGFHPVAIASRDPAHARAVAERHGISRAYDHFRQLLDDRSVEVLDVAVPPDIQAEVIAEAVRHADHIRGILAQKPLGRDFAEAREIVRQCREAGIALAVNQNMRHDQSVRACKGLLERGYLGEPVLATIEMRAVPHWQPWQERLGWVTLRIMSIHHLDTFRYWFGDPERVFASIRPDPRTAEKFAHDDGVCLYVLEYGNGLRATSCDDVWAGPTLPDATPDHYVRWRVEGTEGLALGTIGWPSYPKHTPSTLDFASRRCPGGWHAPRWPEAWFAEAFAGPMAELLTALEEGTAPPISGADNLRTMALVEACYQSAREHRAVELAEFLRDESP